jgi:hypothetical protein
VTKSPWRVARQNAAALSRTLNYEHFGGASPPGTQVCHACAGTATFEAYAKSVRAFGSRLSGAGKNMLEAHLAEAAKVPKPAPPPPVPAASVAHSNAMQQTWGPTGGRLSILPTVQAPDFQQVCILPQGFRVQDHHRRIKTLFVIRLLRPCRSQRSQCRSSSMYWAAAWNGRRNCMVSDGPTLNTAGVSTSAGWALMQQGRPASAQGGGTGLQATQNLAGPSIATSAGLYTGMQALSAANLWSQHRHACSGDLPRSALLAAHQSNARPCDSHTPESLPPASAQGTGNAVRMCKLLLWPPFLD